MDKPERKARQRDGLHYQEGKQRIVIYEEYPDQIVVRTVTLGGKKTK